MQYQWKTGLIIIDGFSKQKYSKLSIIRPGQSRLVEFKENRNFFQISRPDCLQVYLCQKLFFLENMGRTYCVQKLFWMSKTISVHDMFSPCSELGIFIYWTCNSMNNLSSYCWLVDTKIRASDKDLPVLDQQIINLLWSTSCKF